MCKIQTMPDFVSACLSIGADCETTADCETVQTTALSFPDSGSNPFHSTIHSLYSLTPSLYFLTTSLYSLTTSLYSLTTSLYSLTTSENLSFPIIFRGYRKRERLLNVLSTFNFQLASTVCNF